MQPEKNTLPYNYKRIIANFANVSFRRQISVWSLLIIMLVQTFGLSLLYGLYYTDKPIFIELFCVNQDKPEMHCVGSCMLSKMDKHQDQDNDKSTTPKVIQFQPLLLDRKSTRLNSSHVAISYAVFC